jgi:hypothetical protein
VRGERREPHFNRRVDVVSSGVVETDLVAGGGHFNATYMAGHRATQLGFLQNVFLV